MKLTAKAWYETSTSRYFLEYPNTNEGFASPWGQYIQQSSTRIDPTWVNGSGATSSIVKFENEKVGEIAGLPITVTGNLTYTTSTGGLLTLTK